MIDFSNTCIFCGSTETLNTVMTMSIDSHDYKIAIDDACEDEALPKKIRKALRSKIEQYEKERVSKEEKLEALKKAAAEFGFELAPTNSSKLMVPTKIESPPPQQTQGSSSQLVIQKNTRNTIKESRQNFMEESAQRAPGFQNTEARNETQQEHKAPVRQQTPNRKAVRKKEWKVADRMGRPAKIPESLIGENGKPDIKIVDSGGNRLLQRRMEALNGARMRAEAQGVAPESQIHDQLSTCISCDGSGAVKDKVCARCQGHGLIGFI
jgi:hypothetical protein